MTANGYEGYWQVNLSVPYVGRCKTINKNANLAIIYGRLRIRHAQVQSQWNLKSLVMIH